MFTIALLSAISCLAALWLFKYFAARKPAVDAAALHAQLDEMLASFDINEREFELKDRKLRRQIRQSAKQADQSNVTTKSVDPVGAKNFSPDARIDTQSVKQLAPRKSRKPKSIAAPPVVDWAPSDSPPIATPTTSPTPALRQTAPTSPTVNSQLSVINSTFPSAFPREPIPPLPKKTVWPIALFSICKKAAITTILVPFQFAAKSFFNLFARKIPPAIPPQPIKHSVAA
jgi:hypothetical protein